jgi:hypothetical protein
MPKPTEAPDLVEPKASTPSPEIERRLAAIVERFPERFSSEQIDEIRDRISKSIAFGTTLAGQHLANGIGTTFDPRAMSRE